MRFLLDENVHSGLFSFLVKLGHDAKFSPKSMKNGKIFELSLKEERILVSRDDDFLDPTYTHSNNFGILFLRVPPKDLEQQKRALTKLLKKFPCTEDFKGKTIKLLSDEEFEFL